MSSYYWCPTTQCFSLSILYLQLGGKGMGATRVKANFNDIESAAQQADKDREDSIKAHAAMEAKTAEEQERQM